jgi:zinc protease
VKTLVLDSPGSPFVAIRILFETGSADDPHGKEGLAALTGSLLVEGGAGPRSYAQILDALYPMATGIGVHVDREVTVIHATVHRDHLLQIYELIRDILLVPRFEAADLERLRADQVNAITAGLRATDDEGLGKEALEALIHAGGPYGRPVEGSVRGIAAITRDDVIAFRHRSYTRDRLTIGLGGAVPEGFAERIAADLAILPERGPDRVPVPPPREPRGLETIVVTKPCRAWAISIGHPLEVTRADEDFYPLYVANSYFGEHRTFNGLLMNAMRADRGLNYGDYSYVEAFVQDGPSTFPLPNLPRRRQAFTIWIRPVAAGNAHFAIRQAMRLLARFVRDGLTPDAFAETRDFLLAYSRLWVQTPARRLGYAMDGAFYGRKSLVDELQDRLRDLRVEEVNAAIRRHLRADRAFAAIVADPEGAEGFVRALGANAPSPIAYATDTKPQVLDEDKEIAVFPLPVDVSGITLVPAETLFETAELPTSGS